MVVQAAREIGDGEVVFVGMRLPLLAFALAKSTHAPRATGLFEVGILRDAPARQLLYTMSDAPNVAGSSWCGSTSEAMALLAQGEVQLGFLGGAEVDRFGNLNTSYVGGYQNPAVKLPGSGGAGDIASLAHRFVVVMEHQARRLPERVAYITSPGYGEGPGWRERMGLPRGGPAAIVTTKAVFEFDRERKCALLRSYHPPLTIEDIRQDTGWKLELAPGCGPTPDPTPEELEIIRRFDPEGFWTG
ncbi:MAG: CoA-transferase [Chloroflexota bacterium]|nr:CoA-transferase [Chloroflexota bacterium]